jgi:spatacsin
MYYCFDILIANDQFESLLGQFSEKSTNGMKASLLAYLNEYHPHNKDYLISITSELLVHILCCGMS